ncbi:MAG TPA: DMT family transporter [Xanthobacteraceae bacterium]|nr:DMT family transporter [Xanthobacteraceae bacterium]
MNPLFGIVLVVVATLAFTLMAALVRFLGQEVPLGEVVFARSFFALIPLLGMILWRGELATALHTRNPFGHFSRSVFGAFGMFLNFAALALLPLADATAISFATPIFSVVLAAIFLGEVIRIRRWSAVGVGFVGVLVMLWPFIGEYRDSNATLGALLGLSGALVVAGAMTQVRHLSRTESTASLVFYFSVTCCLCGLATLPWGWVMPTPREFVLMVTMGLLGGIGQILITESYRHAPASVVAPFSYTAMIYSIVVGYLWFGEVPQAIVLAGAAIVIAAGLFVIWRERKLGLDRTEEKRVSGPPPG